MPVIVPLSVCLNNSILNGPSITHQQARITRDYTRDVQQTTEQYIYIYIFHIIISSQGEYKTPNGYIRDTIYSTISH